MNQYKDYLIISDLDGTLINSRHTISDKNLAAIEDFTSGGGSFAVATGRSIQNIRPFIQNLRLNGPCILYNGAALYDFKAERLLKAEFMKKDILVDYIKYCLAAYSNMAVEIFTSEGMFIISPEKNVDDYVIREKQPFKRSELAEMLKLDWLKLMLYDKHQVLSEARQAFLNFRLNADFDDVFSHEFYFEVLKKGISKGSALQSLRSMEPFKNKTILAVGDYDNDIEMVSLADVGIAVENAREGVKAAANRITVSNDRDAMHDIIYNILPEL